MWRRAWQDRTPYYGKDIEIKLYSSSSDDNPYYYGKLYAFAVLSPSGAYTFDINIMQNKSDAAISRQALRIANMCWALFDKNDVLKEQYIGKNISDINAPRDMFFYFAYYLQYDQPFYKILEGDHRKTLAKEI